MSTSICTEVPVFLTELSEEIRTLEGVSVAENANTQGLRSLVSGTFFSISSWYHFSLSLSLYRHQSPLSLIPPTLFNAQYLLHLPNPPPPHPLPSILLHTRGMSQYIHSSKVARQHYLETEKNQKQLIQF